MRKHLTILIVLTLITLTSSGQAKSNSSIGNFNSDTYSYIRKSIKSDWIKKNPSLSPTKPSFFNITNENQYLISPIQVSGQSIPFVNDYNLSILNFLLTTDSSVVNQQREEADSANDRIKLSWKRKIVGLIWFENKIYSSPINNWCFSSETECPNTYIFPALTFEKIFDVPNALTNNLEGLSIIPYNKVFGTITTKEASIKTSTGKTVTGKGFDLNNDKINDIFLYSEKIDDTTWYTRLYINVNGQWKCKWIELNEECI